MRKVFFSTALLGLNRKSRFMSDDFDLEGKEYSFPITYLVNSAVEKDDEVEVVTIVEHSSNANGKSNQAEDNYKILQQEIQQIADEKGAKLNFTVVDTNSKFDSINVNRLFKKLALMIQENDTLYIDITFGMKPYTMSMFNALCYAVKASENVSVDAVIYSLHYNGDKAKQEDGVSYLYDVSGMFYMNSLISNISGDKQSMDRALNMLISD